MRRALRSDRVDLLLQLRQVGLREAHVVACVIADLEPVMVQSGDLLPRQVVILVRAKREPLGCELVCLADRFPPYGAEAVSPP